jgi:hypothetical protein
MILLGNAKLTLVVGWALIEPAIKQIEMVAM